MPGRFETRSITAIQSKLLEKESTLAFDLASDTEEDNEELLTDSDSEQDTEDETFEPSADDFREESESDNDNFSEPLAKRGRTSRSTSSSTRRGRKPSIVRGKDGHRWYSTARERIPRHLQNVRSFLPSPLGEARLVRSPLDAWSLLFTDDLLEKIVIHTNDEIKRWRDDTESDNVTSPTYNDVDLSEMKAFIGLLYLSGLQKTSTANTEDLWSKEFGCILYRATMSIKRFQFLLRMIRFDDKLTRPERRQEDFAPIREIWEDFLSKCTQFYSPASYCTIDEQVLSFRRRCPFKVYNDAKPDKYGVKIVMLNDSRTYYMCNAEPYMGTVQKESTESVPSYYIRNLSETIHGSGRNITCDNWFSSTEISDKMLSEHSITMVGTLRKNKRQIPPSFKEASPVNSSQFLFDATKVLVKYTPKKNKFMFVLSTLHTMAEIDEENQKQAMISFYNDTKGGTDCFDHMCHEYTVSRKTLRWPLRFWFGMLDQGAINTLILHNFNMANPNLIRREFLKTLFKALIEPQLRVRLAIPNLRRELLVSIEEILDVPTPPPRSPVKEQTRCVFRPRVEDRKVKTTCNRCKNPVCEGHRTVLCSSCGVSDLK